MLEVKAAADLAEAQKRNNVWKQRFKAQGAWDEDKDPVSKLGVPALPMPVAISDKESLAAFFDYLRHDNDESDEGSSYVGGAQPLVRDKETFYGVDVSVWQKGMLYADGRMDLCKMYVPFLTLSCRSSEIREASICRQS